MLGRLPPWSGYTVMSGTECMQEGRTDGIKYNLYSLVRCKERENQAEGRESVSVEWENGG